MEAEGEPARVEAPEEEALEEAPAIGNYKRKTMRTREAKRARQEAPADDL
jgi:hypothetical protein